MTHPSIRRVSRASDLSESLAAAVDACGAPYYYRREFLSAYQAHPVQPVEDGFFLEVADASGAPVAFVPCYLQRDTLGALSTTPDELSLLSHCWHCYDTRLPGVGSDVDLALGLWEAMRDEAARRGVRRFGFINVARGGPDEAVLIAAGLTPAPLDTRYVLDMSGFSDEEDYLASLRISARHEYRRHLRRALEQGVTWTVRRPEPDEPPERMWLLEAGATRAGSTGYYEAGRIAKFVAAVGERARIIEVSLGDDLIAVGILFLDEDRIHTWAAGYDRDRDLPFSPYYVLYAASVRLGLEHRKPLLEGGRRNERFKLRHGMTARPLVSFTATVPDTPG